VNGRSLEIQNCDTVITRWPPDTTEGHRLKIEHRYRRPWNILLTKTFRHRLDATIWGTSTCSCLFNDTVLLPCMTDYFVPGACVNSTPREKQSIMWLHHLLSHAQAVAVRKCEKSRNSSDIMTGNRAPWGSFYGPAINKGRCTRKISLTHWEVVARRQGGFACQCPNTSATVCVCVCVRATNGRSSTSAQMLHKMAAEMVSVARGEKLHSALASTKNLLLST
jgi:hypothetical protein